jgi:DNA-binding winged helix-turn-helix (wHTH) protein/pimeloyl-ACP methyl ester carboxylesterase
VNAPSWAARRWCSWMPTVSPRLIRFDVYVLDLQRCSLRRGEDQIELRPKAFDVLRYLVENPGRIISKEEFIKAVWPGIFVTDDALVQCVRDVRRALCDDAHRIIKTVPRRGYLFTAEPTVAPLDGRVPDADPDIKFCRTTDGVNLAVACTGRGTPLVRIATWFNHLEHDWRVPFRGTLFRFLADRCQLIRYDGRGTGLSDRYVPDISFATFERDLEAVIDNLSLRPYALLGTSQGAAVAIAHAVRHPERVSKMVLHGGFALGRNKRGVTSDVETGQAYLTLMRHGWGDEHSAFLKQLSLLYFPSASAEGIKGLAELQRMATSADNAIRLRTACDYIDVVDLLPRVSTPTLIVHSRYDNAVPFEQGCLLASAIPNAKFVPLESENHVPLPDEPAWPVFTREIEAFLHE